MLRDQAGLRDPEGLGMSCYVFEGSPQGAQPISVRLRVEREIFSTLRVILKRIAWEQ